MFKSYEEELESQDPSGVCSCGVKIYSNDQFNHHEQDMGHMVTLYEEDDEAIQA